MMMFAGGAYIVEQARQDVRAEVRSAMNLTGHFLECTAGGAPGSRAAVPVAGTARCPHLIINFYDSHGNLLDTNELPGDRKPDAPFWFVWLVRASTPPMEASRRTVSFNGHAIGELVIQPDPTYEIDESWDTSSGLLLLLFLFFVAVQQPGVVGSFARAWSGRIHPGCARHIERGHWARACLDSIWPKCRASVSGSITWRRRSSAAWPTTTSLTRRLMQMQEEEREYLWRANCTMRSGSA